MAQYVDEARPRYVANRSGKSAVPDHPSDVQAFHSNFSVAINQIIRNFVLVLAPKVGDTGMYSGYPSLCSPSVSPISLFSRKRALSTPEFREFLLEISRVVYLLSVRSGEEVRQSNIESDSGKDVPNWSGFTKYQKPLPETTYPPLASGKAS